MSETSEAGRVFDAGRQAQGFRSQEHLDAFFAYYDHTNACEAECSQAGEAVWVHDGLQATRRQCAEARELFRRFVEEGDR